MGLVVAVLLMAHGRPLDVEHNPQIIGLFRIEELPQGAQEAVDGPRRESLGV
jgi:hypothetical protein